MPRKLPRNYKKEYAEYHGKPTQRKNRSLRNQARLAKLPLPKSRTRKGYQPVAGPPEIRASKVRDFASLKVKADPQESISPSAEKAI